MVEASWVICPCCGFNHKIYKSGTYHYFKKGEPTFKKEPSIMSFGKVDLTSGDFIIVRDCSGGRGGAGFPITNRLKISQSLQHPEYSSLIEQIDAFTLRWIKFRKLKK